MNLNFTLDNINEVTRTVYEMSKGRRIWALHGEMGAGKTTFIHALCVWLQVESPVSSPTYSIINEYFSKTVGIIYHIDLYRLKDEEEALNAGVEECIISGHFCLIEWTERAPRLLPENCFHITIEAIDVNKRTLQWN